MKRDQHKNFMEKKIKRTSNDTKSGSYNREEKTIIITILVALVIIGALLVNLVFFTPVETEPFSTIYYLDSEKKTDNIPRTVVLGENSTFTLWVGVENQNGTKIDIDYQVQMKIDNVTFSIGNNSVVVKEKFNETLSDGDKCEFPVTINIEKLGTNKIVFELYTIDKTRPKPEIFTGNWVNLSIEAIGAT